MNLLDPRPSWTETSERAALVAAPLVSIHMVTYNHEPYLAEAIQGVLQQKTQYPYELVIGEDCSTDKTRSIALGFQRRNPERIRVLTSTSNVGALQNCARALSACRGKYIAFCEGDDFWHDPLKLQKQVATLESAPGNALVHTDSDYLYQSTGRLVSSYHRLMHPNPLPGPEVPLMLLDLRYSIVPCTICVRTEALRRGLQELGELCSDRFPMTDLQICFACAQHGTVHFLEESMATRRVLDESASHSSNPYKLLQFSEGNYRFRLMCLERFFVGPRAEAARTRILRSKHRTMLWQAFLCGDAPAAAAAVAGMERLGDVPAFKQRLLAKATSNRTLRLAVVGYHHLKRHLLRRERFGY